MNRKHPAASSTFRPRPAPGVLAGAVTLVLSLPAFSASHVTEMAPVVVTATRTPVADRDVPAANTVITREQIKQTPAQDLAEVIRASTGITLFGRGVGNRRVINLRGLDSHHTLILIDGRRVSASDAVVGHSDFENNWLPVEAIERIEIVRGPLSSLYGSEGMGGVINVITRKAQGQWTGTVSATVGERDDDRGGSERTVGFHAAGPLGDKVSLSVQGELADHERTDDKDDPLISEIEGRDLTAGGFTLGYQPAKGHTIELYHNRIDEERRRDTRSRSGVLHESTYELDRRMTSLEHRGRFGETQTTLRLYESSIDVDNVTTNGVTPATPQKLTDTVLEGYATLPVGERHLLTAGGEYREERLDHIMLADGTDTADHKALYLQDELELSENLLLTLGARVDDHELFGTESSPRAYVVYHLSQSVTIKGGYGEGFRAPTLKQISPDYRFTGFHTFVGNPDLRPETSRTTEIALQYRGDGSFAGITLFSNDVEDLIDTQCIVNCTLPFGREFEYVNVDKAGIDGVEAEFSKVLPSGFDVGVNLTSLDANNETSGEPLEHRPELSANVKVGWRSTDDDLSVALRAQYIGEQVAFDTTTRIDLPSYNLWHFSLRKRLGRTFTLRSGVENITDVRLADKSAAFSFEERGRFYYVGVEATF